MGDYPTLRATTDQSDPGLTHATAIADVAGLQNMNLDRDGNYYLTGNIDASATSGWNGGAGFIPIGADTTTSVFNGTFDGCGYTITGLYIHRASNGQSLFGYVKAPAKIANVTLADVNITGGNNYCAALVSWQQTSAITGNILIQNCHVSGTITSHGTSMFYYGGLVGLTGSLGSSIGGTNYIYDSSSSCTLDMVNAASGNYRGGLVGYGQYLTAQNSFATGSLVNGNVVDTGTNFGGFIGRAAGDCVFSFCYATGDIEAVDADGGSCGGFMGNAVGGTGLMTFDSCSATGDVSGGNDVGGFVGNSSAASGPVAYTDCYAWGNVTATNDPAEAGGFCGAANDDASETFTNCYSIGTITGTTFTGGFIGNAHESLTASYCYWDTDTSGMTTTSENKGAGQTTLWLKRNPNYPSSWDFDLIWYQTYTPAVASTSAYYISSPSLIGETVTILADGEVLANQVVADDGTITLDAMYQVVHWGLAYESKLKPMKPVSQPDMMSKTVTCKEMGISVHNTDDIKYGVHDDDMHDINFDDVQWKNKSEIDGLFTGTVAVSVPDGFSVNCPLQITTSAPLPATVRAMIPKVD